MTNNNLNQQSFSPFNIKPANVVRVIWRHSLEQYFNKEDLLKPEKWRQVVKANPKLQTGDIIEVIREDNAFYAELLVVGKVNDDLFLKIIHFLNLEEEEEEKLAKESDFEILYKGPVRKHVIIRKSDSKEIKDKLASKQEAKFWFKNNY